MKKLLGLILILFVSAGLLACSDDEKETSPSTESVVAKSIIDIPTCVTTTSGIDARKQRRSAGGEVQSVYDVYDGIIENIAAVDEWKEHVLEVIRIVETLNGFTTEGRYEDAVTGETIVWGPSDNDAYERMVEMYWDDELGFQAYLTLGTINAKGHLVWDFTVAEDDDNPDNRAKVEIVFDGMSEPKELQIKATNMNPLDDTDEPEKAWVKITKDSAGKVNLWGNYGFLNLDVADSGAAEARHYVFAVTGYDETVTGNMGNKAVMNLALPLSTRDTLVGMWDTDSVGSIFYDVIRDMLTQPLLTMLSIGEVVPVGTTPDTITDEQIVQILEYVQQGNDVTPGVDALLFVLDLVNPAYFNATGFVGTFDGENGSLTEIPEGFESIDLTTVENDVKTPAEVAALTIDFL